MKFERIVKRVEIPNFGAVYIRSLTAAEYARATADTGKEDADSSLRTSGELIAYSFCDESGQLVGMPAQEVGELPAAVVNVLIDAILELNGVGSCPLAASSASSST